jgi:kumamolisin
MANIGKSTYFLTGSAKTPKPIDGKTISQNEPVEFSAFVPTSSEIDDFTKFLTGQIAQGDLFSNRIPSFRQFSQRFGATPAAMKRGIEILRKCNLDIIRTDSTSGEIVTRGTIAAANRLIPNLNLARVEIDGQQYRMRSGMHEVAAPVGTISRLAGLDNTPLCTSKIRIPHRPFRPADASAFQPLELIPLFNVPADATGKGQKIGIVALDGGYNPQNAVDYVRNVMGLSNKNVKVTVIKLDGATGAPQKFGADVETILDVCGSLGAYDAEIFVVIALNTSLSFAHAIAKLIALGCTIVTISWGTAEVNWTADGIEAMRFQFKAAAALGVSVFAAAGDNLAPDGAAGFNTDYPSSDPLVHGMIGLFLSKDGSIKRIWNNGDSGTGGGVSQLFPLEDWEVLKVASLTDGAFRHVVGGFAGPGDQNSGVLVSQDGNIFSVGGTSAVGPLFAYMTARANQAKGRPLGFFRPLVEANRGSDIVIPITEGNNAAPSGTGYDAVSLTAGMINWGNLLAKLAA